MAEVNVDDGLFGTWTDHDGWRCQAEHMASFENSARHVLQSPSLPLHKRDILSVLLLLVL